MKAAFKVYTKGPGYFLVAGNTEPAVRERAVELGIKGVVGVEPHTPRPWPDPETLSARDRARGKALRAAETRRASRTPG